MTNGHKRDDLQEALATALNDINAESGTLMLLDEKKGELFIKTSVSKPGSQPLSETIISQTRVKLDNTSPSGLVVKLNKPLLINDIEGLKKVFPSLTTIANPKRYKSSLLVPVDTPNGPKAVLSFSNRSDNKHFSEHDLNLAVMLAKYFGAALKLERKNLELRTFNNVIQKINATNDLHNIFKTIVSSGKDMVECKNVSIMLIENNNLIVKDSSRKSIIGQSRKLGAGASGWVWKTGEPLLIKRAEDSRKERSFKPLGKPGSFIVVPMSISYESPFAVNVSLKSNATIGVLNFSNKNNMKPFTDEDLDVISNFANLAAVAIEKVKFFLETKRAYLSTVEALAAAIDAKDKSSYTHLKRVVRLSLELADKVGLSEKEKEDLHFAALLHDVGKIGIEESILNKPGKLTAEEYARMKKHVEEGVQILSNAQFLEAATLIVRHHHEQFSGAGYPDGLKGNEIPIGARILSLADSYDAMITNRIYRAGKSIESAKEELKRCAGKQFDPSLVPIFLKIIDANIPAEKKSQI